MVNFRVEPLTERITRIWGICREQAYLICGDEKAALVDTCSGVGDLRSVVESLTDKPVTVFLTHGHVDHCNGTAQFGTVYMAPEDAEVYRSHSQIEMRKAYLSASPVFGAVTEDDYQPVDDPARFLPIFDGSRFDLGGITLEAAACHGHTPGIVMFLLPELRTLISGDACAFFTMMQGDFCLTVAEYEQNLRAAAEKLAGKYDTVLMSHSNLQAPVTLLDEVLEVCREVRNGTDDKVPFGYLGSNGFVAKSFGHTGRGAYARDDGKTGNLVYHGERIELPAEKA